MLQAHNNLHESRFKKLLFVLRLCGLKLKSASRINAVYSAIILVCFYITTAGLFMETFDQMHNLKYAMKKLPVLVGFILLTWMHLSFR